MSVGMGPFILNGNSTSFTRDFEAWFPRPFDTDDWTGRAVQGEAWTPATLSSETWTATTKQAEAWTSAVIHPDSWSVE